MPYVVLQHRRWSAYQGEEEFVEHFEGKVISSETLKDIMGGDFGFRSEGYFEQVFMNILTSRAQAEFRETSQENTIAPNGRLL